MSGTKKVVNICKSYRYMESVCKVENLNFKIASVFTLNIVLSLTNFSICYKSIAQHLY